MTIFAITMSKGGTGKTITALNLAAGLARDGFSVLAIDLDPQGSLTKTLLMDGVSVTSGIAEVLSGEKEPGKVVMNYKEENLFFIPSTPSLKKYNTSYITDLEILFVFREKISHFDYDFIIIDTPSNTGQLMQMAMAAAHRVIIPVKASFFDMEQVDETFKVYAKIKSRINPGLEGIKIVLTQFGPRVICRDVHEALKTAYQKQIFETVIRQNVRLEESPAHKKSIFSYDLSSHGTEDYEKLTKEVLKWLKEA